VTDSFDLTAVSASLADTIYATKIHHLLTVGSTNALALEAAQTGAPNGSVWIADEQTAGRGRGGHTWHSRAGDGLYVSILLRPQIPLADALWLSLATGLAVQSAIAAVTTLKPDIRWPNDLLLNNRKCGGILVETAATPSQPHEPAMLRYAVIGIGINVNHQSFPDELKPLATSLFNETGRTWQREQLLVDLLQQLQQQIDLLQSELSGTTPPSLLQRFTEASTWVRGKPVSVDEGGGYTGVTTGLDARGFLQVIGDDGLQHTVLSGGVRAR
jgi:BirA family transcriptional regulator, biotin operon repressor / biotin---[acetyl-CoA-carboxylase] ligase